MAARWRNAAWMVALWAAGVATAGAVAFLFKLLMLGAVRA
ncbi:DUF2474 family protein [Achromobacter aloeverae]|uniref:DUF2474 domain-containing protein n=1 Tax=Achromobacter aloeverae TaxID=1750518 RepID=A0A4Q1HJJ4_9BURK|nr:DUF2474 family protein [Achromobacter aloeverae]RXN90266.1 DUF2474 domain-containing protein [Achromobacter aloeverae]